MATIANYVVKGRQINQYSWEGPSARQSRLRAYLTCFGAINLAKMWMKTTIDRRKDREDCYLIVCLEFTRLVKSQFEAALRLINYRVLMRG